MKHIEEEGCEEGQVIDASLNRVDIVVDQILGCHIQGQGDKYHTKSDNRMDRCWLSGALGDALHALSCAAGYNIRWLMRAIVRLRKLENHVRQEAEALLETYKSALGLE